MAEGLVDDAIPDLPMEVQGIHAVHPQGRFTQPKVRAFSDYLAQQLAGKGPMDW
jgi:DNA-binding transcriptional LysR family regulator